MNEDIDYAKSGIDDYARWVFEFTDAHGDLEKAFEFARLFKERLAGFYLDGKVELTLGADNTPPEYVKAGRLFWVEIFEGDRYKVPREVIERLSSDKAAPFVVFGRLQSNAYEIGYRGGNRNFDDLSNDLASGGALH
jgi:hypothetical protein